MAINETQERILDAAERLIGDQGYAATSLRQIIAEAGVNLAAVHYHFGSKEELLDAVVVRKAGPVNEARIAALDVAEREAGDGRLEIDTVLDCFFRPMAEVTGRNQGFVRLMGRIYSEGLMPQIVEKHFRPTMGRFLAAFRRALPNLPEEELLWRVHFMVGAMAHTMCGPSSLPGLMEGPVDLPRRIERLQTFLSAG